MAGPLDLDRIEAIAPGESPGPEIMAPEIDWSALSKREVLGVSPCAGDQAAAEKSRAR